MEKKEPNKELDLLKTQIAELAKQNEALAKQNELLMNSLLLKNNNQNNDNDDSPIDIKTRYYGFSSLNSPSDNISYSFDGYGDVLSVGKQDFGLLIQSKNSVKQSIEKGIFELVNEDDYKRFKIQKRKDLSPKGIENLLLADKTEEEIFQNILNLIENDDAVKMTFVYTLVGFLQDPNSNVYKKLGRGVTRLIDENITNGMLDKLVHF